MLDPLRGEHTEPARRTAISRDGREFDPSTDRWKLNKDLTLNLGLVLCRLDPPLRAPYRAVMEHFARSYSAPYCSAIQMFLLAFLRATGATSGTDQNLGIHLYTCEWLRPEARGARGRGVQRGEGAPAPAGYASAGEGG